MRIVCLSDTHGTHERLTVPEGDLLVHAGDFTNLGRPAEIERFDRWLGTLPHPHKLVIAGNHDFLFERKPEKARALLTNARYLQDEACEVNGLRLWGSPWQPWFHDWAFNLARGPELAAKWALVPERIDVLVTHGPPAAILDRTHGGEAVVAPTCAARSSACARACTSSATSTRASGACRSTARSSSTRRCATSRAARGTTRS
jgi:predicted phosphodiesterase